MPSNLPYSSASNPTGAVPVRETVSSPSGATLVRFVQTNPFDANNNGIVDRVDGMDALAGSVLALGTLPSRVSALEVKPVATLVSGLVPGEQLPTLAGLKHQLLALTDPTGADKLIPGGWSIGSLWVNVVAGRVWLCVNNGIVGAAVWKDLTALTPVATPNLKVIAAVGDPTPLPVADIELVSRATPVSVGGSTTLFQLDATVLPITLHLYRNGLLLEPLGADYTDGVGGQITLVSPLGATERLRATYYRTNPYYAGS